MKARKLILVALLLVFANAGIGQNTIDHLGKIRMRYNNNGTPDTLTMSFSGDTVKYNANEGFHKFNGGVIVDSLKFSGENNWNSSGGGGNSTLNDTIFDILSSHSLEITTEPGDGTYHHYLDTMGVNIKGWYRYREDYYPEGGGDVETTLDSANSFVSVKNRISIETNYDADNYPVVSGKSYIRLFGSTAEIDTQDSLYNKNPSYFSQFAIQPHHIKFLIDNYVDDYGEGKSITLNADSILFMLRSGYEYPILNYITMKEDGLRIYDRGNKTRIGVQISGSLTDNSPTAAEITGIVEKSASEAGKGYQVTIKDTDGSGLLYKVESDGTNWFYAVMTKAL